MPLSKIQARSLPAGSVLQVVQAVETARISKASSNTNNFTDAFMSASITPSATSNKVLVIVSATIGWGSGTLHTKVLRGTTDIFRGNANGNRLQSANSHRFSSTTYTLGMDISNIHFLDSPSTTSSTTYNFVASLGTPYTSNIILNGTETNTDASYGGAAASSITLMEIAG